MLKKSKLSSHVLGKVKIFLHILSLFNKHFIQNVWRLADHDCDGMLDIEEFALAMHLIKVGTALRT